MVLELERAQGMGDPHDRIALTVCTAVGGLDAPSVDLSPMSGVKNGLDRIKNAEVSKKTSAFYFTDAYPVSQAHPHVLHRAKQ